MGFCTLLCVGFVLSRGLHHTKRIALFPRPSLWAYALWVLRATFLVGCSLWAVPCGLFLECYRFLQLFATESRCCVPVGLILICGFYQIFKSDSVGFLPRVQNFSLINHINQCVLPPPLFSSLA